MGVPIDIPQAGVAKKAQGRIAHKLHTICEWFLSAVKRSLRMCEFVRGFPPLCRFSRQSDSWWRCLSTGRAWRGSWCIGFSRIRSCRSGCAACSCVGVEGRVNEEEDLLVCTARERATKGETCAGQITDSFQAHKDDAAFLEPCLCVPRLWTGCGALHVQCEWVSCLHTVDFLAFFPGNRHHHHFSDDVSCHVLQLVCHYEIGHCEVEDEDEDAAGGFLRGCL